MMPGKELDANDDGAMTPITPNSPRRDPENETSEVLEAAVIDYQTTLPESTCEMCSNYEASVTRLQDAERDLKEQLRAAQELAARYEKELSDERIYRKELESKLTTLSQETDIRVQEFVESDSSLEQRLEMLAMKQEQDLKVMQDELESARSKSDTLDGEIEELNRRYEKLLGLNRQKASEMREQNIELPQAVDELEFLALQLREELIETRAAYEHSVAELKDELTVARQHLLEMQMRLKETEEILDETSVAGLQIHDQRQRQTSSGGGSLQHSPTTQRSYVEDIGPEIQRYRQIIAELEDQIAAIQKDRSETDSLRREAGEYREKCARLQRELDTTTQVQKDFVELSQHLQIQLEKIRQEEHEVRWQFDEDIVQCNRCQTAFDTKPKHAGRSKHHCLHCGKIFCQDCLTGEVISGPNRRPAKVCDVCHTLLNSDSIPFFSKAAGEAASTNNSANTE
ncbi:rabaptin-like protein domain-containing protein [Ditylenchus destructor]|uniref:Rabaptin-like protein domain-containing protein n=1 Tax=Ditylenchus destructor TaxID=166010 RepID=A0AAD4R540_9BILA|nr:rabaptin-like protein domain-containing protein [Ditylenchus destructor]